ncbi:hypothetical protein J2T13_001409 [Paenibacillus sp. DS2015]
MSLNIDLVGEEKRKQNEFVNARTYIYAARPRN